MEHHLNKNEVYKEKDSLNLFYLVTAQKET
jgi:hypothetical protein